MCTLVGIEERGGENGNGVNLVVSNRGGFSIAEKNPD